MAACTHVDQVQLTVLPEEVAGCEECLEVGDPWCHLRICLTCGHVGCCDSSPNRHASKHAAATEHPIMRSLQPGEDWSCRAFRARRCAPDTLARGAYAAPMATRTPHPIVLVHGLWMTPRSWEHWKERFESRGHEVITPGWPGLDVEVEALRADPTPLKHLGFRHTADNYERLIREMDRPPIIMGHSMGGAVTQVLIDRGCGVAAVGVAPATVKGVYDVPLSTIRAISSVVANPFNRSGAAPLGKKQFHYNFANTLTRAESDALWERYAVPAANRLVYDVLTANFSPNAPTKVDFAKPDRVPYLAIGFEHDHVVPPGPIRHNSEKYKSGTVAFTTFPGRPHFPGAPGWEEVADYALKWATDQADKRAMVESESPMSAADVP